ncbi:MAG: hypothetical protein ACOYI7_08460 [Candidatus Excrementavichristensenella sp.]|jgi:Na+/proline symporter
MSEVQHVRRREVSAGEREGAGQYPRKREVSVLNWMGTLILSAIPVVNLIFFIVSICKSRQPSKRNYAIAMIILIVLALLLAFAGVAFFADELVAWLQTVRSSLDGLNVPI